MADADSQVLRRSIPYPGGACNARIGAGAIECLGSAAQAAVTPRRALLASEKGCSAETVELARRQLTDAGFLVEKTELPADRSELTYAHTPELLAEFARAELTADDLVVAVGHADSLSFALMCCGLWCAGVTCAIVALDSAAALESVVSPRMLALSADDPGSGRLMPAGNPRVLIFDTDLTEDPEGEYSALAHAHMVATAVGEGEKGIAELAESADALMEGDLETLARTLGDTLRARGRFACSTAVSMKQSLEYGEVVARALSRLVPELAPAVALSEALRFSSRVAIGVSEKAEVDLVFTQDALLDRLGLPEARFSIEPDAFIAALREECFRMGNRFMIALPVGPAKVRLSSIEDEVLTEHAQAFCESRARS